MVNTPVSPESPIATFVSNDNNEDALNASCPFEGPEKLLEIWFKPDSASCFTKRPAAEPGNHDPVGLRQIDRAIWEEMLDIVKCKVLNVINGREMDAYLLSESSFFVFPHKLILKTCGTTLNLLGLPRILEIARDHCGFDQVWRCFYSRKSFMFPERQMGPHREWRDEVGYLDALFDNGAAYTVGKVNGDHWLLYITSPRDEEEGVLDVDQYAPGAQSDDGSNVSDGHPAVPSMTSSVTSADTLYHWPTFEKGDYTIELLMTKLAAPARRPFFFLEEDLASVGDGEDDSAVTILTGADCAAKGKAVSRKLGIDSIFPRSKTTLDSFAFEPCGYSANALIDCRAENGDEGYYTIHVTPEEGWSYASFECNVPVSARHEPSEQGKVHETMPDLETLIRRVVNIFQPGNLSLTLFVSSASPATIPLGTSFDAPTSVEIAQRLFRQALVSQGYKCSDKINYEFGGYDLAFATFQKNYKHH